MTSPSGVAPLRPICFILIGPTRTPQVEKEVGIILLSTRMSSSGRSRSRSAWVYAENMPLQVLGVPLVYPRGVGFGPGSTTPRLRS